MMGLPWEELGTLIELRDGLLRPGTREMQPTERSAIQRATAQRVYAYFDAILDERTAAPRDDILSLFVTTESEGDRLTRDEVLAICFVLLTAGLDTVTDSLTCFFAFLAQHPDHRRRIVDDPDVIPGAVEELLRWETPVPAVVRWAREEPVARAGTVTAGHHVLVNLSAANLDPAEFPDPLAVQFDRAGEPPRRVRRGCAPLPRLPPGAPRAAGRAAGVAPAHPRVHAQPGLRGQLPAAAPVRARPAALDVAPRRLT